MLNSHALLEKAEGLGFFLSGICDAVPPPHYEAYLDWLRRVDVGSMTYLKRHADLKSHPEHLLPGAKSVLVVALNTFSPHSYQPGQMKIATYAQGRDYHLTIRSRLKKLVKWLGVEYPGIRTRICVDSAPLLERDLAQLAGIGWFGKNTMIINSKRGSWFVLGAVLMDLQFTPSAPAIGSCGTCTKCIDACPTGAIVPIRDHFEVAPDRCISYLTIEHKGSFSREQSQMVGDWTFGCDICQSVCPFNQSRPSQPLRAPLSKDSDVAQHRPWPTLVELAKLKDTDWDVLTRGSPVRRPGREGLIRNATANLENLAALPEETDPKGG